MTRFACMALLAMGLTGIGHADEIPISQAKTLCANGDFGPRTAYGETKDEAAAKKLVFEWACMTLVDGKVKEAFAKYVSRNFCDHSHMVTAGLKPCGDYAETETAFEGMSKMLVKNGNIEFPTSGTVNGEMVTQWGAGADIFRVHDGKITDHWDASPPVTITMTAHDRKFSDRMQKQIDTGVRAGPAFAITQ